MSISNKTDFFLNFQQFGDMKRLARENPNEASSAVARQLEGLFVQQMLAAMRAASNIDAGQHSSYLDTYQEMYDKQLAQTIAGQDRLGVARMIMQQMPGNEVNKVENVAGLQPVSVPQTAAVTTVPARADVKIAPAEDAITPVGNSNVVLGKVVDNDFAEAAQIEQLNSRWQNPGNFVADIWPQAQSAAKSLGVSPELLVAQSALETGWGKHTMKFDDGRSSFNLFGIKAGPDWQGRSLHKASLEYRDGSLQNQVSHFRAYASPAQSLSDYVDFIQSSPRYQPALSQADNDRAYIRAIQEAGYATDPQYADKVIGIMNGEMLRATLAGLDTGVIDYA